MTFEEWSEVRGRAVIAEHAGQDGAALPILHALQATFGYVPREALRLTAEALNLTRAEIHGVASFYHDFRETPPGTHLLKLCRAEACQAMGADEIAHRIRTRLRIDWGQTSADGAVTLEPVFCLGLCACGPAAILDGQLIGRLDEAKVNSLLGQFEP